MAVNNERIENRLSEKHLTMLRKESGISDEVINHRGYRTITEPKELQQLGFDQKQCRVPGLLLPSYAPDGSNSLYACRPDNPRVIVNQKKRNSDGSYKHQVIKYETPKGAGLRIDCPPACREKLKDLAVPLWITEGQKKGDALASNELNAIALFAVSGFKGKNEFGGVTFLADWDHIALNGREVRIVFDSDVMLKVEVRRMLDRLIEHLQRKKAHVVAVYLPANGDQKVGVDEYLTIHSVAELEALVESPRPQVQPAAPIVELLDSVPLIIRKPLSLINNRAYAAIWPYVRVSTTEIKDKDGYIIRVSNKKRETTKNTKFKKV